MKILLSLLLLFCSVPRAVSQGCVSTETNRPLLSALCDPKPTAHSHHPFTVRVDWRSLSAFRGFSGETEEIARQKQGLIPNVHQNLYTVNLTYELTPRWSVNALVPVVRNTRNQPYAPFGVYEVGGLGDMILGVQGWVLRPPAERSGNIALGVGLKLPTGINNATGTGLLASGVREKVTTDTSIQPGDGSWGFVLNAQAFKRTYFGVRGYFQGSWLFNPRDTNGVPTFRANPGEGLISVTDRYLFRGGAAHAVPHLRGVTGSFGGRMEGVPVRDAFGSSDGFRRPFYIISIDPGIVYEHRHSTLSLNAPWAVQRNRRRSITDMLNGIHGDAPFPDYSIVASVAHTF